MRRWKAEYQITYHIGVPRWCMFVLRRELMVCELSPRRLNVGFVTAICNVTVVGGLTP